MSNRPFETGFTLVELMIVVAIAAILLGVGVPSLKDWTSESKMRNRAESIQQGLSLAKSQAMARNWFASFTVTPDGGWTVACAPAKDDNANGVEDSGDCIFTRTVRGGDISQSAYTQAVAPLSATTVTFGPMGTVVANRDAGPSASLQRVDFTPSSGPRSVRVQVNAGGQVKLCEPSAAAASPKAC